jgi:hypothetical protein
MLFPVCKSTMRVILLLSLTSQAQGRCTGGVLKRYWGYSRDKDTIRFLKSSLPQWHVSLAPVTVPHGAWNSFSSCTMHTGTFPDRDKRSSCFERRVNKHNYFTSFPEAETSGFMIYWKRTCVDRGWNLTRVAYRSQIFSVTYIMFGRNVSISLLANCLIAEAKHTLCSLLEYLQLYGCMAILFLIQFFEMFHITSVMVGFWFNWNIFVK